MSHRQPLPSPDSADCWLTLRYLTGDLDEAEWAAFEERVAVDAALQGALAETVKLTTGLSQIDRPSTPVCPAPVIRRRQPSHRWQVGLAAIVGLFAVGFLLQAPSSSPDGLTSTGDDCVPVHIAAVDVPSVVATWSALAADELENGERAMSADAGLFPDSEGIDVLDVPDWLLVAVRDESDDASAPADDGPSGEQL